MGLKEQFDAMDLTALQEFMGNQEENLHLDFKRIGGPKFDSRDDRKNLAIVLSGFANSDGGICVWGIDARKNGDGLDVAQTIEAIPQIAHAIPRLNDLTGNAVNPTVDGVEHKAIFTRGTDGVAVTLVPPSDSGPHMAKQGEDRYYKRSGGSFIKMEHFDIEDMFGRRAKPILSLTAQVRPNGSRTENGKEIPQYLAIISICNTGRGTAVGPCLKLRVDRPHRVYEYGLDGNGRLGLPLMNISRFSDWKAYGGQEGQLVYPGVDLDVTAISLEYPPDSRILNVEVEFQLAAANARLTQGTFTIPADAIMSAGT